ncbi:hypothetical protein [Curtobacterium pusillum]|uniref:Uncharacterized protein n=1 Tax=Curtobacterium pusillum TaxID=69373 RepID=A0ABX2MCT9_9MICO|nr:hypothetical protein [Curtobacterium pusillum]NUU13129.1 hypothetical protein [Curtobacterium pusillum]
MTGDPNDTDLPDTVDSVLVHDERRRDVRDPRGDETPATSRGIRCSLGWSASRRSIRGVGTFAPRKRARGLTTQRCQAVPRLQIDAVAVVMLRKERQVLVPPHVFQGIRVKVPHQAGRPRFGMAIGNCLA